MKECGWTAKASWQKPETKDDIQYESIHLTFHKGQNNKGKKKRKEKEKKQLGQWLPGTEAKGVPVKMRFWGGL